MARALSDSDDSDTAEVAGQDASLLAAIVNSSRDAIIGKDLEGNITSWNTGAENMYGYSAGEAIGRHISLIMVPERRGHSGESLTRLVDSGNVEHHQGQRRRKDGEVIDVSITRSLTKDVSGTVTGTATIARDITDQLVLERAQRTLENRLNQLERLESMGRLAGGIAHDFNNLLAVILNYVSFVSEELDDKEAAMADLAQIHAAAERASELTRRLLSFARREVVQPKVMNLNDVVGEVEQMLHRTIGEHIQVLVSLSDDLWLIEADPGQLEQVLVNLAVNARDAMPEGGLLTIDTDNVEIDSGFSETHPGLKPGTYVRLRVSDTGSGMEQSVLEHVFEPFFTTKSQGEGTGLGLPMVFGIVARAGGEIQIYSEIGIGTTCRVLLPTTDRPLTAPIGKKAARVRGGTETVLVVEDEDALREVTRRILVRSGYDVIICADGPEAIAFVESHNGPIDLLLTDVIMPQMLGKEVAERIREIRPDLPVMYMSGYAQSVLGSTLGEEISLLEKPFSEQLLLSKVRSVLDDVKPGRGRTGQ